MKKVVLAGVFSFVAVTGSLSAQPGYPYGAGQGYYPGSAPRAYSGSRGYAPPAARQQNPTAVLKSGMEKMLAFLRQTPAPDRLRIAAFLDQEIAPFFDFEYMGQAVAGKLYRDMSDAQRKRLEARLKEEFLGTLAARLAEYDQQQVVYLPARRGRGDRVSLSIAVQEAGPYPTRIDFRLRRTDDGWKVYDVAANNSSALAFYRNYFRQSVARGSGGAAPYRGGYR